MHSTDPHSDSSGGRTGQQADRCRHRLVAEKQLPSAGPSEWICDINTKNNLPVSNVLLEASPTSNTADIVLWVYCTQWNIFFMHAQQRNGWIDHRFILNILTYTSHYEFSVFQPSNLTKYRTCLLIFVDVPLATALLQQRITLLFPLKIVHPYTVLCAT